MKEIIVSFLSEQKEKNGMKPVVDKTELALVQSAYMAVRDRYPEKHHVQIVRICCDTIIEAEKKNIQGKIGFMANVVNDEMEQFSFDSLMKTFDNKVMIK